MVVLGGLEVLAAGYLIHKHNKNKREKARLDEEAAALTEQQYPILPPPRPSSAQPYTSHHHSGGRHSHDGKYSQSYDGGRRPHSHDRKHSHGRHRKDSSSRPPQYVPPPYASQANLAVPGQGPQGPQMGYHAPPPSQQPIPQQQPQQSQTPDPQGYYPPTGIPAHWEQSRGSRSPQPQQNTRDREIKYGFYDGQEHPSSSRQDSPRGRSHTRASGSGSSPYGVGNERSQESRVRFAEEDEILGDGPPPYRA